VEEALVRNLGLSHALRARGVDAPLLQGLLAHVVKPRVLARAQRMEGGRRRVRLEKGLLFTDPHSVVVYIPTDCYVCRPTTTIGSACHDAQWWHYTGCDRGPRPPPTSSPTGAAAARRAAARRRPPPRHPPASGTPPSAAGPRPQALTSTRPHAALRCPRPACRRTSRGADACPQACAWAPSTLAAPPRPTLGNWARVCRSLASTLFPSPSHGCARQYPLSPRLPA
jgi:hypothetical protein